VEPPGNVIVQGKLLRTGPTDVAIVRHRDEPYDVFGEAEGALNLLRKNPGDQHALAVLEQATERLKAGSKPKPQTPPRDTPADRAPARR
jgi:hypothetical protein